MLKSRTFLASLALVALALIVLATSCSLQITRSGDKNDRSAAEQNLEGLPPEFSRLQEVWGLLRREHFERERLDAPKISDAAIRGMLQGLNDPYASYLDPAQYALESQDFKGSFEGIGAEVAIRDGRITIIAPLPDTPAERAGIRPGDIILEIDGQSTKGITLLEAVSKIRGQKGSTVRLGVLHINSKEPVSITVARDVIKLRSVRFSMLKDGIGHLRIVTFSESTNKEVQQALADLKRASGSALILDLRNNPGGLLSAVVDVASQFLDDGLVLYEMDAQGQRTDWKVRSGGQGVNIPMVLLVNEFSASASEVLAGAIADHDRAPLIGNTTFGKGSVNTLRPLKDGSGIYFTIARWFTPKGTLIEGKGITPGIEVINPPDGSKDIQLDRAIQLVQERLVQPG